MAGLIYKEDVLPMSISPETIKQLCKQLPLLEHVVNREDVLWLNPNKQRMDEISELPVSLKDMEDAEALWKRFAPFLRKAFPESVPENGVIESPFQEIQKMKTELEANRTRIAGRLFLKCDHALPVAGSIKARGGFYEVLHYAESLALKHGLISAEEDYAVFTDERLKSFFSNYSIGVGSTGNLGLSIGIISAKLGFKVDVYMSRDAKEWKKKLLREKGVTVHEFAGDFGEAIKEGRRLTQANPKGYFVDDEDSENLFLGYSTAAFRLKQQLEEQQIHIDADHPLFVYLPCGVGGAPGGVAFGLKQLFGDHVHCFFAEPVDSPSVLVGLMTGLMDKVSVQDFGLSNKTEADGLAVGTPSSFASPISNRLISAVYTFQDAELNRLLAELADTEDIWVEPSATAGLIGPQRILDSSYMDTVQADHSNITHIAWSTGGNLVPEQEMRAFYTKGKQ